MQITQSIDLNLSIDGIPPQLHMPQGDSNTRAIVAALWDGAQPYNIPTDAAVMVRFRKPDGTGGLYDTTEAGSKVTFSGNTVTAPVATQMLAVPGIVMAEINVYAPGSYVPTNSRGDVDGDGVVTQDDLKMLAYHLSGTQPLEDASNADANGDGVIDAKDLTYMSQQLDKAAKQLSSFAFALCVAPCVYTDAFIISSDYYNILSADIAKVLAIETYPPIIGENGNWFFWDTSSKKYTDTGKTSKGTDGTTPHIGENGNWYIGSTDTGKPSRGKDGTTPHIGANGNWYVGDTDTGVSADGAGHIFKVIVVDGTGGPDTLSADKTFADIKSAYTAGNIVVVLHGSALYELTYMGDVRAEFTRVNATYYEVMSCTNSGAPQEVDGWQLNRTKRINYDTKYGDIGNKTVPVAIKELQDKSAPAVTDTDAGKYLHVNSSTKELEWAAAEAATHETAGVVKPGYDFDIAADGTLSLYKAIAVNSLTLNKGAVYEIGSAVTGLDAAWVLNKAPAEQTITVPEYAVTIENIGADVRSTTGLTGNAATQWNGVKTQEKTSGTLAVVLTVKDDRGAAASKTASIQWLNGVYTGAAEAPATIDSAFILTLTKSLQGGKGKTFTVNAATGAYIWYACPVRYGAPNFNVGGFDGGFSKVATLDYTNAVGYTEEYQVWRSDNAGLGSTTVKVS